MGVSKDKAAIFVFSLIQDVTVLRPLIYLASDDFGVQPILVVTPGFRQRDKSGIWQKELEEFSDECHGQIIQLKKTWQFWQEFGTARGAVIFGSESVLRNHAETRDLARYCPPGLTKIALQHGHECVGFLMNRHHKEAHGDSVGMESDILCSWQPVAHLRDLNPTLQSRIVHTGPSALIRETSKRKISGIDKPSRAEEGSGIGLVCENLHSVRFELGGEARSGFLDVFERFAEQLRSSGKTVALRPHPAGQYMVRQSNAIPENVLLELRPTYKIDWSQYCYGISAPSTVLMDMLANGIPAATWVDQHGELDTTNYGKLPKVSTLEEWMRFSNTANRDDAQLNFLLGNTSSELCADRFRALFQTVLEQAPSIKPSKNPTQSVALGLALLIADDPQLPTLQICLLSGGGGVEGSDQSRIIAPTRLNKELAAAGLSAPERLEDILRRIEAAISRGITSAVFCRYVGPYHNEIISLLKKNNIATFYFIDDLLTSVPAHIGENKQKRYSSSQVRGSLLNLLEKCDKVVTSSAVLATELKLDASAIKSLDWMGVSCSGRVRHECDQNLSPLPSDKIIIGYMGFDHDADFELIASSVAKQLREHPTLHFELIGPMRLHPELEPHRERITVLKPLYDYALFVRMLAMRRWHIGLAPLIDSRFNRCKSVNKWIEYTACGIVTIASRGVIYDEVCKDGSGLLASSPQEWETSLAQAITNHDLRHTTVVKAQKLLQERFSPTEHKKRLLDVFQITRAGKSM